MRSRERRNQADEKSGRHRHSKREREHLRIESDLRGARDGGRRESDEDAHEPGRERDANDAAHDREDRAFREHLSNETPATRAERETDGHLSPAGRASCQARAGEIHARDEQHEGDGAEENAQIVAHVADEIALQVDDAGIECGIVLRKLTLEPRGDSGHLLLRPHR